MVRAGGVEAVLVGDDLPELGADLVAALAALNVADFLWVGGGGRGMVASSCAFCLKRAAYRRVAYGMPRWDAVSPPFAGRGW